jgi:hypothetical protein
MAMKNHRDWVTGDFCLELMGNDDDLNGIQWNLPFGDVT